MKQDFLLEILCEELPHSSLDPERGECRKIAEGLEQRLVKEKIPFHAKNFFLTPRRIVVIFREVEEFLPAQEVLTKGPPLSICFSKDKSTPALTGFMRGLPGLKDFSSADQLPQWREAAETGFYRRVYGDNEFLLHCQQIPDRRVTEFLKTVVPEVLSEITFTKSMHWGDRKGPFLRPIRSLAALWGKEVIPLIFAGLTAGNCTRGHRFLSTGIVKITKASHYPDILRREMVIVDPAERVDMIMEGLKQIETGKEVKAVERNKVTEIVSRLTEYPVPVYAEVEPELFKIPREVVVSEMVEHQMYFPVEDREGNLIPGFIFTANGVQTPEVISGNRNVLSSRLRDGIFLYGEDLKAGLEKLSAKTDRIVFENTLGSYADKCTRIAQLASLLKGHSGDAFSSVEDEVILPLSRLIKADLASGMVYEFPHLQGIMGEYYVKELSGHPFLNLELNQEMAASVREHYLPLSAQGEMPKTVLGKLFSLADKLDNLLGLFAVNLIPSGNNDPYALRRQGYGVLRILKENKISLSLRDIALKGAELYTGFSKNKDWIAQVIEFLENRFKTYGKDCGFASDEGEAVLDQEFNPFDRCLRMEAIRLERHTRIFEDILSGLKRITNIIDKIHPSEREKYNIIDKRLAQHLTQDAEKELFQTYQTIELKSKEFFKLEHYREWLTHLGSYPQVLERFFREVMVNAEDTNLRRNRITLLIAVKEQMVRFFDISKIR